MSEKHKEAIKALAKDIRARAEKWEEKGIDTDFLIKCTTCHEYFVSEEGEPIPCACDRKFIEETESSCETCRGYGLHANGAYTPMGPMDARDGLPTISCPECGANHNKEGDEP